MSITVLVVDDEENFRTNLQEFLSSHEYEVIGVETLNEARNCLKRGDGDVVLLDVQLPDGYGPNLLAEFSHLPNRPPIIMITAFGDIEMAVNAMKIGAHDFLTKPIQFARLEQSIQRASELVAMRRELEHYRAAQQKKINFVVGTTPKMKTVVSQAQRAATSMVSVLITGETGTGKGELAKYIHQIGPRSQKPFIAIDCPSIQATMVESELFGYEAGAFTGAERRKHGLMEVADGGVLWLDEISSMSLDMQSKLLRAIDERAFRRVGGTSLIHIDVQILAASNRNLLSMINEGYFREDLYYRLKVVDLDLPPLRERKNDIPALVGFIIGDNCGRLGVNISDISQPAMETLMNYDWPGNIRELRNAIERAMLFCDDEVIDLHHLPTDIVHPKKDKK
jgi:two-component system response regulator AtoC